MPQRLLLADDSVTIQRVIELTFADEDVTVVAVSDGDAAIARLQSEPFDIVLADIGMPKRGGYEIAEFVRSTSALAGLPVLLLTGAFEPVDESRVAAVGGAGVLAKPFEPQQVITRVRDLLRRGRSAPADPAPGSPATGADALLAAPSPTATGSVDDYFAQLDRAFASLSPTLAPREAAAPPADPKASDPSDVPAADAEPAFVLEPTSQTASASGGAAAASPPANADAPGALADTFATLLAVERGELPASALEGPSGVAVTDDLVERVARQVAERLADGAVREMAADIVSRTAERLVREEIDRIKSSLPDR